MLRIRSIKPDFWKDEGLSEMPASARLLYIGLWMLADREGRLENRPARIRAEIFPYASREPVEKYLQELSERGYLLPYEADGKRFLEIPGFKKHQRINLRESASILPARASTCAHMPASGDLIRSDLNRTEQNGSEGKGSEEGKGGPFLEMAPLPKNESERKQFLRDQAAVLLTQTNERAKP